MGDNGDLWNGENLSIFSKDHINIGDDDYLLKGGRSLAAAIRPYPTRVAGDIVKYGFNPYRKDKIFELIFTADHTIPTCETEIFIPKYQYPFGVIVTILKGGTSTSSSDDDEENNEHGQGGALLEEEDAGTAA